MCCHLGRAGANKSPVMLKAGPWPPGGGFDEEKLQLRDEPSPGATGRGCHVASAPSIPGSVPAKAHNGIESKQPTEGQKYGPSMPSTSDPRFSPSPPRGALCAQPGSWNLSRIGWGTVGDPYWEVPSWEAAPALADSGAWPRCSSSAARHRRAHGAGTTGRRGAERGRAGRASARGVRPCPQTLLGCLLLLLLLLQGPHLGVVLVGERLPLLAVVGDSVEHGSDLLVETGEFLEERIPAPLWCRGHAPGPRARERHGRERPPWEPAAWGRGLPVAQQFAC